jgi:benzoate-CoA ligase family protein
MRYEDLPRAFNIGSYFVDRNEPDRTALITSGGRTSYGELATLSNQVGHALRALGVRRGDRVLLALNDGVEFIATWYGAQKIGAITAEAYSFLKPKEYRYYGDYVEPAVIVTDSSTVDRVRDAGLTNLLVIGVEEDLLLDGEQDFHSLVSAQPTSLDALLLGPDDVVMWKFTTGSTGKPKAAVLAARSPVLSYEWFARGVLDIRPDDLVLPVPKLFFGYARDLAGMFPFGVGASAILFPEKSTVDKLFELIALHRPTILVNVPTMMSAMVSHPRAAEQDLSSLRLCVSAGEALPAELHRRWTDTFGVDIVDVIGSAEVYNGYISNAPGQARPGSLGKAVPGYRVRVVDEDGNAVPDGEVGVLEVVGETVAIEYWNDPERSATTFPREHTTITGDLFTRDADGFFYYRGRADDLLKVSGVWVSPIEIENCLIAHPAVVECAVIGYEDGGLTRTRAYVVANAEVSATELQNFVRTRLSPHKYPRDVRFVADLPKTTNGKLDRRALRGG